MHQAIVTKYHGATNTHGVRVSARADAGRVTLPWNYALDSRQNHVAAAKFLAAKVGWEGRWYGGGTPDLKAGYVFVPGDGAPAFEIG